MKGTTPILRSYHYIRLTARNRESFLDNLVSAYNSLNIGNKVGITGIELKKLIQMLCQDFPPEIFKSILRMLDKSENSIVCFQEFISAINAVLLYEGKKKEMIFFYI